MHVTVKVLNRYSTVSYTHLDVYKRQVFAIPEMGRFYRHVLIEGNYPHHGAVAFGHYGKALYEVFKYIGVELDEIGFNQPKGMLYKSENPFA